MKINLALLLLLFFSLQLACSPPVEPLPIPTAALPLTLPPPTPIIEPTITTPADTGWLELQPGLEKRLINQFNSQNQIIDTIYLLRVDPHLFQFAVAYQPRQPLTLTEWKNKTEALIVMNAGYFTEEYLATGLIVTDGIPNGTSYGEFAGMLAITESETRLRWLSTEPYQGEPLQGAIQAFPMLVKPGGVLGFPEEDNRHARRTAIAQDHNGRFLLLVTTTNSFTLHTLSQFLLNPEFNIDRALNLDGGTSSGLLFGNGPDGTPVDGVTPFVPLPAIITIHPKNK